MRFDGLTDEDATPRPLRVRAMLGRLVPLLGPHRRALATGVGLLALSLGAEVTLPLVLRHMIDAAIPSHETGAILATAGLFLGLFLLARAAGYLQLVTLVRMGLEVVTALKKRLFDHLLSLSLDYYDRNSPGKLMARVESDAERLVALFSDAGIQLAGTGLLLASTIGLMIAADVRIALAVLALIVPIAVVNLFYVGWLRRFYANARRAYVRLSSFLSEYVQAAPIVQVYGLEAPARERLARANRAWLEADTRAGFREYPFWGAVQAAEAAVVGVILYFGTRRVFGAAMSLGTLVLFVEYARRLFQPIVQLSEQLSFVQRAFASADRVFEILDTPSRTPDRPDARPEVPRAWSELAFEDVSFAYGEPPPPLPLRPPGAAMARDGARRAAIERVRFTVRRGERLALVGVSGGGKTTVASLLLRFYDPTEGRITLDGEDIRSFEKRAWRRFVGLVLQEIHLFPGTIRENLTVFCDGVPEETIARALEMAGARDAVERAPRGLETDLAEGGANLSMGERQLVSFARAVVRDPEILVLDEATSSVDPGTERRLAASLERLLAGRTSIIIAHRLETVRRADRILVMHAGRVAEEGRHEDLYAKGGLYRALCDLQLGGEGVPAPGPGAARAAAGV
jgi:ATP-binding cassette subfamily B protein